MNETPNADPPKGRPKGARTEWVTRRYDEDGELVSEIVTTETKITPKADAQPEPGGYL